MVTAIQGFDVTGYGYKYDQLNRIAGMQAWTDINMVNWTWQNSTPNNDMFSTRYTYDANGNIETLHRYDTIGNILDSLVYTYHDVGGKRQHNRLLHVEDMAGNTVVDGDYEDLTNFSSSDHTFEYDAIGNLVNDDYEGLEIRWNVYGKVDSVIDSAEDEQIIFSYDASGQRIWKKVEEISSGNYVQTFYFRDGSGNVMSTYSYNDTVVNLGEFHLYGSSRLGLFKPSGLSVTDTTLNGTSLVLYNHDLGEKQFELSNHLGNVLATISDRRNPVESGTSGIIDFYEVALLSAQDYYPFGMVMPDRDTAFSLRYRYGFTGMEQDNEVKGDGNSLDFGARIYDSRLGRWMSRDPNFKDYPYRSDYSYVGNSPIFRIDPNGRWEVEVHAFTDRSKFGYGIAIVKNDAGDVLFRTVVRLEGTGGTNHFTRNANTPTGTYTIDGWAEWASASTSNRVSYGPNEVLKLTPYSGEIKNTGRGGIHNHGGRQEWQTETGFVEREDPKLGKTHGCIRWFDEDIAEVKSLTDGLITDGMPEKPTFQNITDDLVFDDKTERYFIPDELNSLNTLRQEESSLSSMVAFLQEHVDNPDINVNGTIGRIILTLTTQKLEQTKQRLTEVTSQISEQSELGINSDSLVPAAE